MKSKHWILIIVLAFLIVGWNFIFGGGTFFLLDFIPFPIRALSHDPRAVSGYRFVHDGLQMLLGYKIFPKLYFFAILVLSGYLGGLFARRIAQRFELNRGYSQFLIAIGILFMMINPVLYERMITQPGVYLAMIMLGYGFYFLLKTTKEFRYSLFLRTGFFRGIAVSISAHMVFMAALLFLFYLIFYARSWKWLWATLITAWAVLLMNANWLIGGFLGKGAVITDTVASFNQANIDNFTSHALAPLNVELTNLVLHGFWGERYGHFALAKSVNPLWWVHSFLIFVMVIYGYYKLYQKDKKRAFWMGISGILAWIAATGISSSWFWSVNQRLFDHIPFYIGLREPQKWVGLLLIVYAQGFLIAVYVLLRSLVALFTTWTFKKMARIFGGILFLMLWLWTPHLLFGFHDQLYSADYPKSYAQYYEQHYSSQDKTLILPWHSYVMCDRSRRVIANPMKAFLGNSKNLITSDNIEVGTLYSNSTSEESQDIETFLETRDLALLKKWGIEKILFMEKCADFKKYEYLEDLTGLQTIRKSDNLTEFSL